ncbi:hypothetical protein CMEL01_13760 [Colletotrichum melonis]|uniref:Uncharacterized protein n=1 Tax=Colletotrichum melonis TaxID=1209925 RepID=A0AAI9XSZ0_9PEZI|nr:hypothetical protein CMEL01_13760 [Colletotrichum melonis]
MTASNQRQARKGSKRMARREIDQPVLLVPVPIFCAPAPAPAVLRLRDPVCPLLIQVQSNLRVQVPAKGSTTTRATGRRTDGLVRIGYPTCRSGCRAGRLGLGLGSLEGLPWGCAQVNPGRRTDTPRKLESWIRLWLDARVLPMAALIEAVRRCLYVRPVLACNAIPFSTSNRRPETNSCERGLRDAQSPPSSLSVEFLLRLPLLLAGVTSLQTNSG